MHTTSDLQYQLQQSRSKIAREYLLLSDSLNVAKRLEESIKKKPWPWISALFFVGTALPWCFKKSTHPHTHELQEPHKIHVNPFQEKKEHSSAFSKCFLLATSLLQDKTVYSGLFSVMRFLLPLGQEAIADYRAKRKSKQSCS